MRVLFYLPIVTPWWFENIVEPMIRRVAAIADVHVLAPDPWRNTGVGPRDIERCIDLPRVNWAITNGPDHRSLRTRPADPAGLIEYVTRLAPDYVFCRTADFDTVKHFPGTVRFLMEVAAAPFHVAACTASITADPFVNGALPVLSPGEWDQLEDLIAPLWSKMRAHWAATIPSRADVFRQLGILEDRPVLLLPLEYEHEENFFLQHRVGPPDTRGLLTELAKRVTPGCTLIVTNHPLNVLHCDGRGLVATVDRLGPRVILAKPRVCGVPATLALAPHVGGMLLGDSKAFSLAACFGVPMLRRSRFASAGWLNAATDLNGFVSAVRAGNARAPMEADARRWFACHLANEAFHPGEPELTGEMILDRAERPVNPERWAAGIRRVRVVKEALFR